MEEEPAEKMIDVGDDAPKEEDSFMTFGKKYINTLGEGERAMLGYKRKRKEKKEKVPQRLPFGAYAIKKAKREPSIFQTLFNKIINKPDVSYIDVENEAKKLNYKMDDETIKFFVELSAAKYSAKKVGLPSIFCKQPLHLYAKTPYVTETGFVTNDYLTWAIYSSPLISSSVWSENFSKYKDAIINPKLKEMSFVTDSVFQLTNSTSGYIQDFNENYSVIITADLEEKEVRDFIQDLNENKVVAQNVTTLDNKNFTVYATTNILLYVPQGTTTDDIAKILIRTKCVNTKNKLSSGLKKFKANDKIGYYINLHDIKLTKFTPSVLFLTPGIKKPTLFISGELDTNEVYNALDTFINSGAKTTRVLPLPPNAIFWDNLNSFVYMLNLLTITSKSATTEFLKEAYDIAEIYFTYKDVIKAWKNAYNLFSNTVLNFYDAVTGRITIDSITKLKSKAYDFIQLYNSLRNDKSYVNIANLITLLPNNTLMRNFISNTASSDLMNAIYNFITVLETGKSLSEKKLSIVDMYKSLGILCNSVFFDEGYAVIPKIRSKAAFLGGSGKDMNEETYTKNVLYLLNKFKEKKEAKKEATSMLISYKDLDEVISQVINNSINLLDDTSLKKNIDEIKKQIRSDEILYEDLRNEIMEQLAVNEKNDIVAVGDFLDVPSFMNFITAFQQLYLLLDNSTENVDANKILSSIQTKPHKVRKFRRIKKKKKRAKEDLPKLEANLDTNLTIDTTTLSKAASKLKEGKTSDELGNAVNLIAAKFEKK